MKMSFFKKYRDYILIAILVVFAILPLFRSGFFPIHDDEQVGRLYEMHQSLRAGEFPVRLAQDLGFGFDYPLFNFYPSFIYYFAEIFVLLGFSFIVSIKLMIACGFLFAAWFMYLFTKEYFGRYGAIVAAIAYTYAPYHSVDVYVRGALPEFWSFVFIPALFYIYKKLSDTKNNKYVIFSGLLYSGLILTHNLVAMMSGIFLGIYIIYLFVLSSQKGKFMTQVFASGILALLLSAFFWIPSFFERDATMINLLTTELADYTQHFVYLRQLWDSPWGYGGSLYGLDDGLSFQIGKLHIVGSILAGLLVCILFIKKKKNLGIVFLFLVLFLLAVFMTTFYSTNIWKILSGVFAYIQFPWRFLLFVSFTSSFLLGCFFLLIKKQKYQIILAAFIIGVIILVYKDFFVPSKYLENVIDENYISKSVLQWRTSIMAFEYVPKGIKTKTSANNTTVIAITQNDVASSNYKILKGNIQVTEVEIKPHIKKFQLNGTGGTLQLQTFAFPGWKIMLDNKEIQYTANNNYKLIDINVPAGEHNLTAQFVNTPVRTLGNSLSLAGILSIILYIFIALLSKANKSKLTDKRHTKND